MDIQFALPQLLSAQAGRGVRTASRTGGRTFPSFRQMSDEAPGQCWLQVDTGGVASGPGEVGTAGALLGWAGSSGSRIAYRLERVKGDCEETPAESVLRPRHTTSVQDSCLLRSARFGVEPGPVAVLPTGDVGACLGPHLMSGTKNATRKNNVYYVIKIIMSILHYNGYLT